MKVLVVLALFAFATAFDFPEEWEEWKKTHSKRYPNSTEEFRRHTIWQANKKFIDTHNVHADKQGYSLGMNAFGDLENHEIVSIFNGYIMQEPRKNSTGKVFVPDPNFVPLADVDWREKGAVTPIKNQGQCGSCWAFSSTGSLEGQHFLKKGELVSLSEQDLVDCSTKYGNLGCQGGRMDAAFEYIKAYGGVDTEASYPYMADTLPCRFSKEDVGATDDGHTSIKSGDESGLTNAISSIGPVSVAMDASLSSFHFYKSGIYYDSSCSSLQLDHGVLAVGYGSDDKGDYYIVKNSWGTEWGMEGYFKLARNRHNACGVATQACYPIVD